MLLTRSAVLVGNVGIEATIPNYEVFSTGKHGHGGGKTDRQWQKKAVKSMSTCEH